MRRRLVALAGLAAVLGGLMWLAKAGAILVSGAQPPLLFEGAPPLFAVGLVGLHARLKGQPPALRTAGVWLADMAIAAWLCTLV